MTQLIVDIGDAPADGSGDPIRTSFDKVNKNFDELYSIVNNGLPPPPLGVLSVSGRTGNVLLNATDIIGGTSKYYVDARINELLGLPPPPPPEGGAPYTNSQINQLILNLRGDVYTKSEVDQLLLNISIGGSGLNLDYGFIVDTATVTDDFGSII